MSYLNALNDGVFTAFVDGVVVHPSVQRRGIGKAPLHAAETYFVGIPLYVMPFEDQQEFFRKQGYSATRHAMCALSI
ncbi:MAG: GNAT family N-acetyltransferase [Gammaproteobacteria bacterium]